MIAESADTLRIDAALREWRQGDVILESPLRFIHHADLTHPVSEEAVTQPAMDGEATTLAVLESEEDGFVLVTQTCDVVRGCRERPYVELAPLVEVSPAVLAEVRGLRRPGFGYVPAVAERNLVADLDRTMTIEKGVLVGLPRLRGITTDAESRAFAAALARKRARFAFPNAFVDLIKPVAERLQRRYGRDSEEGRHVSALR